MSVCCVNVKIRQGLFMTSKHTLNCYVVLPLVVYLTFTCQHCLDPHSKMVAVFGVRTTFLCISSDPHSCCKLTSAS